MLIVGEPNGVCPNLSDERCVFQMILLRECIPLVRSVLMTGNAPQGHLLSVQNKSLLRIDPEGTDACLYSDLIRYLTVL